MSMSSSVIGIQSGSESFNTASGKYCCNYLDTHMEERYVEEFQYRKR